VTCFAGAPGDALEFFGVERFDDVYVALEEQGADTWHERFAARETAPEPVEPAAGPRRARALPLRAVGPQAWTLTRRYARLFRRDERNLRILAIQVPLLGLATGLLFRAEVFSRDDPAQMFAGESAQLLFLLVTIAIWFGAIAAAREIVKERAVVSRELAVGVRRPAYLISKATVLFALTGIQTLALAAIVLTLRPLQAASGAAPSIAAILVLTAWVGVAMGLLVSVYVRSEDQASSFIPLILVPQLLFGGAIVPTEQMGGLMALLSKVFVAQWAFGGAGTTIDLDSRIAEDAVFSKANRYGPDFFDLGAPATLATLLFFLAIFAIAVERRLPEFARSD
jgi:hypothetical protein